MSLTVSILIEVRMPLGSGHEEVKETARRIQVPTFQLDPDYGPHPMTPPASHADQLRAAAQSTYILRGTIDPARISALEAHPSVLKVWSDPQIEPDSDGGCGCSRPANQRLQLVQAGTCPVPPCDCDTNTAKGGIPEVAAYLGVDQLWAQGIKGKGVVIGIVDGGILAKGRSPNGVVDNVTDGWPADWGRVANAGQHGCMTATDALGMAPEANLYDMRILNPVGSFLSDALDAYTWAFNHYQRDRTPQILSNSWGVKDPTTAWDFCTDPDHPFTRKCIEMIQAGVTIVFSAGNCGATCPDRNCGQYIGPGKDMWGSRGHPLIMAVGAVNTRGEFIGYSSAGPAALSDKKPDFCAVSHFRGYFPVDTGTSAACPVAAGVMALLKQSFPLVRPTQMQNVLKLTARQLGAGGWNQYTGAGVIQAKAAYDYLSNVYPLFAEPEPVRDAASREALRRMLTGSDQVAAASLAADATIAMFTGPGQDARNGQDGAPPPAALAPLPQAEKGDPGTPGNCGNWGSDTQPGRGDPGHEGQKGSAGNPGQAGVRGDDGGNGQSLIIDSRVFTGTISLNFRGGNGGNGGRGGAGQAGQQGQQGGPGGKGGAAMKCKQDGPQGPGGAGGNGGNGGAGGRGGDGGNGGDGGQIVLIYDPAKPQPSVQAVPTDGLSSGRGGIAGQGGPGGAGGKGGAGGQGSTVGTAGSDGSTGAQGNPGYNGVNGAPAVVRIQKSSS